MKKFCRIFLAGVLMILSSSTFAKQKSASKLIDEDLAQFEEILTQGYVAYDKAVKENGFNIKKTLKKVKSTYKKYEAYRKMQKKDYKYVNGIDVNALGFALADVVRPALNIKDMHLSGSLDGSSQYMSYPQFIYFVDVWFKKTDDGYFVTKSNVAQVKVGDKYTGDEQNMRPWIIDGELLYKFGYMNNYFKEAEISINRNTITAECNKYEYIQIKDEWLNLIETEDTMYISISTCMLAENNASRHKELLNQLEEIAKKATNAKTKKNIILDLRNNLGGYQNYPQRILAAIFTGKEYAANESTEFDSVIRLAEFGTITLNSPFIAKTKLEDVLTNRSYDTNLIASVRTNYDDMMKNPSRYYGGYENPSLSYLPMMENPAFKGNFIILINKSTASAAEKTITFSYLTKNQNVILVGENSNGCIDYGGVMYSTLKNSGITVQFSTQDFTNHASLKQNPKWHGDTLGFMPDYWTDKSNLMETLIYLTGDEEILHALAGLENEML